jgi:catechol 2,3-dioxygenase-like lactoylglutathione lyase family enzyme
MTPYWAPSAAAGSWTSELSSATGSADNTGTGFRESHLAFEAPSRAAVRAFFAAAVGTGAEVLYEPRLWPEYHASYYGVFVRDPDGNNVEAVCHLPED